MPGKKLLVADDSLTIQKVIRLALSNEGYEIQAVSDGNDAIQQISLFRPDVVLIDISLPGKSAFEVKREANEHEDLAEIRFVLMSSAFEQVDEEQAEEVEFHGRLIKPFDPANLRQVLLEVLSQVVAKRMEKTVQTSLPPSALPPLPKFFETEPPQEFGFPPLPEFSPDFPPELPSAGPPGFSPEFSPTLPPLPDFVELSGPINSPPALSDFQQPMEPNEPPPMPLPEQPEPIETLWETPPPTPNQITPPPPPERSEPGSEPGSEEDEIRSLTESTIRISGMNDFEWNVNDPAMKPLPNMMQDKGSHFDIEPPPPPGSSFNMPEFKPENAESSESSAKSLFKAPPPQMGGLSTPDFETLVERQVEAALARMAQKLLPEIAEKLIKQEIHKMLKEPSTD